MTASSEDFLCGDDFDAACTYIYNGTYIHNGLPKLKSAFGLWSGSMF